MDTKRILIVEDDQSVRVLLKLFLMRGKYTVNEARNGLEGYGIARQVEPHLIITDLNMPVMDGVALIRSIRNDEKLKNTRIIVLTGTTSDQQQLANQAGADAVLNKPVTRRDILAVIEAMLQ